MDHPRAELPGDLGSIVAGPRVYDHNLIEQIRDGAQTLLEIFFLIPDDHVQGELAGLVR